MWIAPVSGARKPATRLRSVVFPPPEGPSSVRSSPRAMSRLASCRATTSPKRFVTPWTRTKPGSAAAGATGSAGEGSARVFDIEDLAEPEERVREDEQGGGRDDVHDRHRRHRRIGVFADVVVHRDRQGLGALRGHEERGGELVEGEDRGKE